MSLSTILLMSVITFYMRYAFFIKNIPLTLSPNLQRLLSFTAPCILISMAAPIVFGDASLQIEMLKNPLFTAGIMAIIFSLVIRNILIVVLLSMTAFSLIKIFIT